MKIRAALTAREHSVRARTDVKSTQRQKSCFEPGPRARGTFWRKRRVESAFNADDGDRPAQRHRGQLAANSCHCVLSTTVPRSESCILPDTYRHSIPRQGRYTPLLPWPPPNPPPNPSLKRFSRSLALQHHWCAQRKYRTSWTAYGLSPGHRRELAYRLHEQGSAPDHARAGNGSGLDDRTPLLG